MQKSKSLLCLNEALRRSEATQPSCLLVVSRPTLSVVMHRAKIVLRLGVTLRGSESKQSPCLGKVFWLTFETRRYQQFCRTNVSWPPVAVEAESAADHDLLIAEHAHLTKVGLRFDVALRCCETEQPPCFGEVSLRPLS